VTHRGPCQPLPFCDSVIPLGSDQGALQESFLVLAGDLLPWGVRLLLKSPVTAMSVTQLHLQGTFFAPKGSAEAAHHGRGRAEELLAGSCSSWGALGSGSSSTSAAPGARGGGQPGEPARELRAPRRGCPGPGIPCKGAAKPASSFGAYFVKEKCYFQKLFCIT